MKKSKKRMCILCGKAVDSKPNSYYCGVCRSRLPGLRRQGTCHCSNGDSNGGPRKKLPD